MIRQVVFLNLFAQLPDVDQVENKGPKGLPGAAE